MLQHFKILLYLLSSCRVRRHQITFILSKATEELSLLPLKGYTYGYFIDRVYSVTSVGLISWEGLYVFPHR